MGFLPHSRNHNSWKKPVMYVKKLIILRLLLVWTLNLLYKMSLLQLLSSIFGPNICVLPQNTKMAFRYCRHSQHSCLGNLEYWISYWTETPKKDHSLNFHGVSTFLRLLFSSLDFTNEKITVKTTSWALEIHYSVAGYLKLRECESELYIKLFFFRVDGLCGHLKQESVSENSTGIVFACSTLHIKEAILHHVKNNELNWHANLSKASLVETHVWNTYV